MMDKTFKRAGLGEEAILEAHYLGGRVELAEQAMPALSKAAFNCAGSMKGA